MNSREDAVCYVAWIASNGNNSTEFQVSEYVFTYDVFSWYEVYPWGIHKYGGSRKPLVKYGKYIQGKGIPVTRSSRYRD